MAGSAPNPPPHGEPVVVQTPAAEAVATGGTVAPAGDLKLSITQGPGDQARAFRSAVARFVAAVDRGDPGDARDAVRCALNIVYVLRVGARSSGDQRPPNADQVEHLASNLYVGALCFVRGRVDHWWGSPIYPDPASSEWRWHVADVLPEPDDPKFNEGRADYVQQLEGQPVLQTLREVEELLAAL